MHKVIHNRLGPFWDQLCQQAQHNHCATDRDREVFEHRARCEGLPFLTDGLAGLGRLLLDGLRKGYITEGEVAQTRSTFQVGSTLPTFLYASWSKIFDDRGFGRGATFEWDAEIPRLVSWEPSYQTCAAVRWLRQLTTVFSKLRLPYAQDRVDQVAERFIANERYLADRSGLLLSSTYTQAVNLQLGDSTVPLATVLVKASRLISKVLCNCDPRDISPRHGSGASACRTRPWERYTNIEYHSELDAIWPYDQFALLSHSKEWDEEFRLKPEFRRQARGVFVPKDYRGPRFISCEPGSLMYYQQGMMTRLVPHIEHHPMTSGFVNFTDQSINQRLAITASRTRELATLDLKDASDLLSWDLIKVLWPVHWLRALNAVRSRTTRLELNGSDVVVPLRKHAPMGSAMCFPVMALTLWALIKAACPRRSPCWVYGDDIIVRCSDAPSVITVLTSVGLAVNADKSFVLRGSPFRESCGVEYFAGENVTPIYLRYDPTTRISEQSSIVSFANNLCERYDPVTMFDIVELAANATGAPIWDGTKTQLTCDDCNDLHLLPELRIIFGDTAPARGDSLRPLLLHSYAHAGENQRRPRTRWNPRLHRREYLIRVPVARVARVNTSQSGYVLRALLINSQFFGLDCTHALAKRVQYKYRWVCLDW